MRKAMLSIDYWNDELEEFDMDMFEEYSNEEIDCSVCNEIFADLDYYFKSKDGNSVCCLSCYEDVKKEGEK